MLIQGASALRKHWVPAFAGMSGRGEAKNTVLTVLTVLIVLIVSILSPGLWDGERIAWFLTVSGSGGPDFCKTLISLGRIARSMRGSGLFHAAHPGESRDPVL